MSNAQFVVNTNGVSIAGLGDSEYVEVSREQADILVDAVMEDGDIPDEINVLRRIDIADMLTVFEAAKALVAAEGDFAGGIRYGDAFSNAYKALDDAVAVAER